MKLTKLLIVAFFCLCAIASAQTGIRWDLGQPGSVGAATIGGTGLSPVLAQPGVTLNWCTYPANAVPCTNYAPTYTSLALTQQCPSNAQIVLQGSTACQATGDNFGNIGVYTVTNTTCTLTCYAYTLTVNGVSYGPYVWTTGGGGGSGAGGAVIFGPQVTGYGSTVAFCSTPCTGSKTLQLTLTGNVTSSTFNTSGIGAGTLFTFQIFEDGIGGHSFVWPSNVIGGVVIDSTAIPSSQYMQIFWFDGTNLQPLTAGTIYP